MLFYYQNSTLCYPFCFCSKKKAFKNKNSMFNDQHLLILIMLYSEKRLLKNKVLNAIRVLL